MCQNMFPMFLLLNEKHLQWEKCRKYICSSDAMAWRGSATATKPPVFAYWRLGSVASRSANGAAPKPIFQVWRQLWSYRAHWCKWGRGTGGGGIRCLQNFLLPHGITARALDAAVKALRSRSCQAFWLFFRDMRGATLRLVQLAILLMKK